MSDMDMKKDPIKRKRAVDEWLDAALDQYGKAEPRAGLEGRVLASLQAERTRAATPSRWWWVTGMTTALAVIAVAIWAWQTNREVRRVDTVGIMNSTHQEAAIHHQTEGHPRKQVVTHGSSGQPMPRVVVAIPKLGQFPSPQPLSEQEKFLMSYVARDPENAVLVAQARAEALARDREEEAAWAAKGNTE